MACFVPVATDLHQSFLKPIEFTTPHPARHSEEIAVVEKVTMLHLTANASCSYDEGLGFRGMVLAEKTSPATLMKH